ncbi:hypothetical protein [Streptomyces yerevanensis]|uniref:hypothetical protein n=1 Tax=Streptomyces yerevanensis TaxID=66378 RepID=UPI000523F2A4|nr:hypothetical protein [Streptomyces yerevanensis]
MSEMTVWFTDEQDAGLALVARFSGIGVSEEDIVRKAVQTYLSGHPWVTPVTEGPVTSYDPVTGLSEV